MKHVAFFNKFLTDEVDLNKTRIERLGDRVEAVSKFLKKNLESYKKIERQGSYALRTVIRPVRDGQDYDADLLLYMEYDKSKKPHEYIDEVYECFKDSGTYKDLVHKRTRCVKLEYKGEIHLDIVPCITKPDGKQYICNNKTQEFEITDGTGFREWFNGKSSITNGNLRKATRLLKFLRDHKGNFKAKSILLTTLIGRTVKGKDDADDFKNVPDALKTVSNRINDFLQENPLRPEIFNPALPEEEFTRDWSQKNYENFREMFDIYNRRIDEAHAATEHNDSVDKWRKVFGDSFGEKKDERGDRNNGRLRRVGTMSSATSVVVTPRRQYAR